MPNTATRLITLIMLLQRQPNQKAADLAEKLGVSVRTLHRYMGMLDDLGIPIYSERGPYGGFSLVRGYRLPPLVFTPEEAVAISLGTELARELWGRLYEQAAQGALAKLENVLPDEQRREVAWAQRTLIATGLHRSDLDALGALLEQARTAIHEQRRVQMLYQGGEQREPVRRRVDLYALVHRWGWWYVIGHCHLREEMRTFRVDRIQELALTEERFERPAEFDVRGYLSAEFQGRGSVTATLRFCPEGAHVAQMSRLAWDSLAAQPDGSVLVRFTAPGLTWAASTVLSYGSLATAVEPPELRDMVREWALAVATQHGQGEPTSYVTTTTDEITRGDEET